MQELNARQQQVLDAHNAGLSVQQAAKRIGITASRVSHIRGYLRDMGYDLSRRKQVCAFRQAGVRLGKMSEPMRKLEPEVKAWVIANIPEGASLADFAMACVADAYFDEHPDG